MIVWKTFVICFVASAVIALQMEQLGYTFVAFLNFCTACMNAGVLLFASHKDLTRDMLE